MEKNGPEIIEFIQSSGFQSTYIETWSSLFIRNLQGSQTCKADKGRATQNGKGIWRGPRGVPALTPHLSAVLRDPSETQISKSPHGSSSFLRPQVGLPQVFAWIVPLQVISFFQAASVLCWSRSSRKKTPRWDKKCKISSGETLEYKRRELE